MKFLKINMTSKTSKFEDVAEKYRNKGGRILSAQLLTDLMNPKADPLSADNVFLMCTGLLAGTQAPCSGRLSVGFKSPLTGTIKESNVGGTSSQALVRNGIKAVIIEGAAAPGSTVLHISSNGVEFIDASDLKGLGTYDVSKKLIDCFGKKSTVLSVGQGAENGYPISSVMATDMEGNPARAAARGGGGLVMYSKGVKAIVIDGAGDYKVAYKDKNLFMENNKKWIDALRENGFTGQAFPALGTAGVLIDAMNAFGCIPVHNYRAGTWDKCSEIGSEKIMSLQAERGGSMVHHCMPGCVVNCSIVYFGSDKQYLTSGFEYETAALFGSNLLIDDIDFIAKCDRMCDDLGVDTMDTACAIGVIMESGKISFGDTVAVEKILTDMKTGVGFGKLVGQGTESTGKELGVRRCPTVKGQSLAGYDPRALPGLGVTYATSPMGADHTDGHTLGMPGADPGANEGQVENASMAQNLIRFVDSMGMCLFTQFAVADPIPSVLAKMLTALTGDKWEDDLISKIGAECTRIEHTFNLDAGFKPKDDTLPEFIKTEPLEPNGYMFTIPDADMQAVLNK